MNPTTQHQMKNDAGMTPKIELVATLNCYSTLTGFAFLFEGHLMIKDTESIFLQWIDSPMQIAVSPCKQRTSENDLTNTCQNQTTLLAVEADLAKIIEAWLQLSDEMRKAIIKMIS